MKPVSVRFACFGPYMAEQFVDFERLEKSGLFLICGETGAGKTTILDAICYALYGKSSGGLRGGLEVMRCALAGSEDDTEVEFIFDSNGKRYKFTRSLKYRTEKNKRSKHLNDYHNALELRDGVEIPIVEKEQDKYVTKKAEELIGLSYDQFRQVIILPQGQFERLLVSPSEEKEAILVSLFHAQRWQRIAEELQRRVAEQDKQLKEERRSIDERLRFYNCQSLAQLEEKQDSQRELLEQRLQQTQDSEAALAAAKGEKERSLLDDQAFRELGQREKRYAALQTKESYFHSEAALLADADKAEQVRPQYLNWQQAEKLQQRAQQNAQINHKTLLQKEQQLELVRQRQQTHAAQKEEMDQLRQQCLRLQNAREVYAFLEQRRRDMDTALADQERAKRNAQMAQQQLDRRTEELNQAMENQNQAMAHYQQMQQRYLLGIGAALARELKPGEPCPVCGSTRHPEPAKPTLEQVTDAQLDRALQQMNAAGSAVAEAMQQRSQAEEKRQTAQAALAEAQRNAAAAESAWQQACLQRLEGIDTEAQRSAMEEKLTRLLAAYDAETEKLQKELTSAMASASAARDMMQASQAELAEAEEALLTQQSVWQTALVEAGLDTQQRYLSADMGAGEKQKRQTALHQYHAELETARCELETQRNLLADKQKPDLAGAQRRLLEAEDQHRKCVTAQTLAAKLLEDLKKDHAQLTLRLEDYNTARIRVDADLVFARRLRGDSGISLQRYVLGVMLTSVTAEANRLLAGVYAGRYRLYRTDEISGRSRKGGLELEVFDSQTNQRRSVTTLSGGEKFLVALSLAIGLSTVVQAQGGGVRLEAMFVDEGFGSLDRESVSDALEVLQGVRRGCGIVGIISHVEQLAEVIPTRLEITKDRRGSNCTLRD